MIALAAISRDEIDIIDLWIRHHLSEGIDRIFIADASTDGTKEILKSYDQITVTDDTEPYCMQSFWMNQMSAMAHEAGATWVLASDCDEFWYATNGQTIKETLTDCPFDVLAARSYQHLDWDTRQTGHKTLPKVAFRSQPGVSLAMGNHSVSIGPGVHGILDLREIQFRGFDHYVAKVAARLDTLDPAARARLDAAHYLWLENKSVDQMREAWGAMWSQQELVCDPIPSHL